MLTAAGVPHEAVASGVDERALEAGLRDVAPVALAATLAQAKALSVPAAPGTLVLGCDSVLDAGEGPVAKPASIEAARTQLLELHGREHRLISAAAIAEGGDIVWRASEVAMLRMRAFGDAFLDDYLGQEWEHIRYCVGGYRIEAMGIQLFDRIEGSHFAILGLPLLPLLDYLRERGVLSS